MALALNNLKKSWYAIKQRNQTKPNYVYDKNKCTYDLVKD